MSEVRDEQEVFVLGLEELEREHARVVGGEPRSVIEVLRSFRRADALPQGGAIPYYREPFARPGSPESNRRNGSLLGESFCLDHSGYDLEITFACSHPQSA